MALRGLGKGGEGGGSDDSSGNSQVRGLSFPARMSVMGHSFDISVLDIPKVSTLLVLNITTVFFVIGSYCHVVDQAGDLQVT